MPSTRTHGLGLGASIVGDVAEVNASRSHDQRRG